MKTLRPHELLPEFPRTPHLPDSLADMGDVVASYHDAACVFRTPFVWVTEKIDGSNLGITLKEDGHFLVRNRTHFLRKGNLPKNPSGQQYLSIWNYLHDRRDRFESLSGFSVYGEWCRMAHGLLYDQLPDLFFAFDLYDPGKGFLPIGESFPLLEKAGFTLPPVIHQGFVRSYEQLHAWCQEPSEYCSDGTPKEGVYLRLESGERFKLVRSDFIRGKYFGPEMVRTKLI